MSGNVNKSENCHILFNVFASYIKESQKEEKGERETKTLCEERNDVGPKTGRWMIIKKLPQAGKWEIRRRKVKACIMDDQTYSKSTDNGRIVTQETHSIYSVTTR